MVDLADRGAFIMVFGKDVAKVEVRLNGMFVYEIKHI